MNVHGKPFRTIWLKEGGQEVVSIIDQRFLPHRFVIEELHTSADTVRAIKDMHVRGAGLIGATAAFGIYLGVLEAGKEKNFDENLQQIAGSLITSRPTAVNLEWAVQRQLDAINKMETLDEKKQVALRTAMQISDEDAEYCRQIGIQGLHLIEQIAKRKNGQRINILTHCNAGWLAFVDYGSATAPIYAAFETGINLHVWVDETRPRNQGASLTAWELLNQGIPHTIITDNAGGHLMQHGLVDLVITGADRVTRCGDAANKIGTYLKALAAFDNEVPFYVALPSSSFDWKIRDGVKEIPIEERDGDEVKYMYGMNENEIKKVLIAPEDSPALNYGFDVTPARLITGLITERGICAAREAEIMRLFPDKFPDHE